MTLTSIWFRLQYNNRDTINSAKLLCHDYTITFSSLYLILSSALANFLFFPLTPRHRGSLLLAAFLFCFSLILCIFSLFLVSHLCFGGGSTSCVSNLRFPCDITRFTEPWLKFLKSHEWLGWLSGRKCLVTLKIDSWASKVDLEMTQISRKEWNCKL